MSDCAVTRSRSLTIRNGNCQRADVVRNDAVGSINTVGIFGANFSGVRAVFNGTTVIKDLL